MQYSWVHQSEADKSLISDLNSQLGIGKTLCEILVQRGISDFEKARTYFRPKLDDLHNPFSMKNMKKAVNRIIEAIEKQETILIFGDYDVDGTTAVSLVYSFLKKHHSKISTYIPDRYNEGYGVSLKGIDYAAENNIPLIIALDCGTKAVDKIAYAKQKGIDFIVCDHHQPGEKLPDAYAILNPKQNNCAYPYKELTGCGIGFKLAQALCKTWKLPEKEWKVLLDLVAVSIGADIVPITGENRVLAFYGLWLINQKPRLGLKKLIEISGGQKKVLSITDVVFLIGPRINAAGRIAHGSLAVRLLCNEQSSEIEELCTTINQHNQERKELDSSITLEALEMLKSDDEKSRKTTVVFDKNWHKGVIGIVASRLIENYYRPTVVFTESNGVLAGSARSVRGYNVYKALEQCEAILEQFGGHKYAAGMTLAKNRFEEFKNHFEKVVSAEIKPDQLIPKIVIDAQLQFDEIKPSFYKTLKQLAPFGPQNMTPIFVSHNLKDAGCRKVGADLSHLRLVLKDINDIVFTGIAFGDAEKLEIIQNNEQISICYHLDENEFNGTTSLQLRVLDIKPSKEVTTN